jgi:dUTP pyrophosphatase
MPKIILEKLHPDVPTPTRGTYGAAGYDVCAFLPEKLSIKGPNRDAVMQAELQSFAGRIKDMVRTDIVSRLGGGSSSASPSIYFSTFDEAREAHNYSGVIELPPGFRVVVPTGLKMRIPPGWEVQVRPRSGLAIKSGITVLNAPGTIDSDYRGELGVILLNTSGNLFKIQHLDRIAQLVPMPTFEMRFEEGRVDDDTDRGDGGFGSTGV